jgi:hypothetical protein
MCRLKRFCAEFPAEGPITLLQMSCNLLHCSHDSRTGPTFLYIAMSTRKLFLLITALVGLATSAFAQSSEATVAKVTGTASVTLPDGTTKALTEGMKVPQGATVTTGADGDVYLETHKGYVTSIKKNSTVSVAEISVANGKENTILELKSGNLVAKLDPSKKAVNNYQVRTPKGVAAARGTVFTVSYNGGTYALSVVQGVVTILPTSADGGVSNSNLGVQVNAGQSSVALATEGHAGGAINTTALNNSNSAAAVDIRELLAVAVATVAVAAQNNIGGTTPAEAASVAAAVFAVVPSAAEQAGAIIKQSTPAGQDNTAVVNAILAVTPESAKAAFTSGTSTGTFTPSTGTTSSDSPKSDTPKSDTGKTTTTPNDVTTPQPIDPTTVSRS